MGLDAVRRLAAVACVGIGLAVVDGRALADAERQRQAAEAMQRGDARTAAALLEREVEQMRGGAGERDPETLGAMADLASAYESLGRTADALALVRRVVSLRSRELERGHPDTLDSLRSLARLLDADGRQAEAVGAAQEALALSRAVHGERSAETAMAMQTLANLHSAGDRLGEALALEERVLEIMRTVRFPMHPDTLVAMGNLASTYRRLGRPEQAVPLEQDVLSVLQRTQGERRPMTLTAMNNLAGTYGELGRHAEAAALFEQVLRVRRAVLGADAPDTLAATINLADAYSALGRRAEAAALVQRALEGSVQALGEGHALTVAALAAATATARAAGRHEEALRLARRRLAASEKLHGPDNSRTLEAVFDLARSLALSGRVAAAATLGERYVAGIERLRITPGLGAETRRTLFESYARAYRTLSYLRALAGDGSGSFRLAELSKARTLLESMAEQRAARLGALPIAERAALEEIDRRVAALDRQVAQAEGSLRQRLDVERNEAVRRHEALRADLKRRYPKYAQLAEVRLLEAADLPGLVPAGGMAVSYVVEGDWVGAHAVGSDGELEFFDLGIVGALAQKVALVRRAVGEFSTLEQALQDAGRRAWRLRDGDIVLSEAGALAPPGATEVRAVEELTAHLGQRLLQPLARRLRDARLWIIAPDGPLAQLPFDLLPPVEPARAQAEHVAIHSTQSLSVYALSRAMLAQYRSLGARRGLLAFGNPQYGAAEGAARARGGLALRGITRLTDLDPQWVPLPGTEAEVRAVAALFPGSASTYVGDQATEQQLQQLQARGELRNFRYVLISAHGFVSQEQPALSSVVLGLRHRTPAADGYVTASEWTGYDLRSDLLVLSACETALGKVVGGEGVMGLSFALFVAGNANTLLTLWPVADDATAVFMTDFFRRLRGGGTAASALAETKREFSRHPRYSHPRYWAPFVLIGAG